MRRTWSSLRRFGAVIQPGYQVRSIHWAWDWQLACRRTGYSDPRCKSGRDQQKLIVKLRWVDNDVEALIRGRHNKIVHQQAVCRFVDLILMFTGLVALSQPRVADRVRNILNM